MSCDSVNTFKRELETVMNALSASALLTEKIRLNAFSTLTKQDDTPVTVADFSSQSLICSHLNKEFPDDSIVAEEDSVKIQGDENKSFATMILEYVRPHLAITSLAELFAAIDSGKSEPSARFWTVDPIDGTKGYILNGHYSLAAALIVDGRVKVGALACPTLVGAPTFGAIEGGGVFVKMKHESTVKRYTRSVSDLAKSYVQSRERVSSNQSTNSKIATQLGLESQAVSMDSQVKYIALVENMASVYLRIPSGQHQNYEEKIWDHAAGSLILKEAGGTTTDKFGNTLSFSERCMDAGAGIVASIGREHSEVIAAVRSVLG